MKKQARQSYNRWFPGKTVEKAFEEGFITRWDLDFYRNIWGKSKLTEKQLIHKSRINELIQDMVNQGIYPSFNQ